MYLAVGSRFTRVKQMEKEMEDLSEFRVIDEVRPVSVDESAQREAILPASERQTETETERERQRERERENEGSLVTGK
ncbi:hypothetical protein chiPu_0027435 [Chiloscyllium punctatum]|uniref:Uncharacterized protein n=1 Tax=Chiloscyllium punctatum TaxID=137246 RepID=A0A401TLQ1_CHIPU|nr:hypothetical protein [Chiloscyllium punctatum]